MMKQLSKVCRREILFQNLTTKIISGRVRTEDVFGRGGSSTDGIQLAEIWTGDI